MNTIRKVDRQNKIRRRSGSLTERLRSDLTTLRQQKQVVKAMRETWLLLDVSGSMGQVVDGKMKLEHLKEAVSDFPTAQILSFSHTVWEGTIPTHPQSNTDMTLGFQTVARKNPKRIILISDGLPDDPTSALESARALSCPVDVIYIGHGGDEGEAFMKLLASQTGGTQVTADTAMPEFQKALTDNIRRLALPK